MNKRYVLQNTNLLKGVTMDREPIAIAITDTFEHVIVKFVAVTIEHIALPLIGIVFIVWVVSKLSKTIR